MALVGGSGSGKSTIVQLLLRLYEPGHGSINIDGVDIKRFTFKSLRSQISTVLQDSFMFDSTIKNNIALMCNDAPEEKIIAAAKAARAHDFIMELPNSKRSLPPHSLSFS